MKASLFENLFLESGGVERETEDYIYCGVCGNLNNIRDNRRESSPCAEEDLIGEIVADAGDYERGNEGDKIARVYYLVLFRSERQDDNGLYYNRCNDPYGRSQASASPAPTAAATIA